MAKIIKLNVYEKTVYAVQVEDNLYIDELGVKHLSPSPENCKNTRNVPPALRTALEHLAKNHTARKKVEDKRTKFLKEISQKLNELEKDKYNKSIPYAYEEYDGNWMMCDEAEEMEAYKKDIKKNEKLLPVSMPINSYMWT